MTSDKWALGRTIACNAAILAAVVRAYCPRTRRRMPPNQPARCRATPYFLAEKLTTAISRRTTRNNGTPNGGVPPRTENNTANYLKTQPLPTADG